MAARMDCAVKTVMAGKKANTTQKTTRPASVLIRPAAYLIVINIIPKKSR